MGIEGLYKKFRHFPFYTFFLYYRKIILYMQPRGRKNFKSFLIFSFDWDKLQLSLKTIGSYLFTNSKDFVP